MAPDGYGYTAVSYAICYERMEMLQALLENRRAYMSTRDLQLGTAAKRPVRALVEDLRTKQSFSVVQVSCLALMWDAAPSTSITTP